MRKILLLLSVFLLAYGFEAEASTYTSTGSGSWVSSIWSCTGTCSTTFPYNGDDVVITSGKFVQFDAGSFPFSPNKITINGGGFLLLYNQPSWAISVTTLIVNGYLGIQAANTNLTVNGPLTIGGTIDIAAGSITYSGGSLSFPTGTITLEDPSACGCGASANSFTINSGSLTVSGGNLTLSGNSTLSIPSGALNVTSGSVTVNTSSTLSSTSGVSFSGGSSTINGTLDVGSNTFSTSIGVSLGGSITNFTTMSFGSTGSITFSANTGILSGGTIDMSTGGNINSTGYAPTITLSGDMICKDNTSFNSAGSSTVVLNGSAATLNGGGGTGSTFNNITVGAGANVSVSNKVNLQGLLSIDATGSFDADGSSNNATFTLISNNSKTQSAKIGALKTDGSNFTGKVTFNRYVPNDLYYQYLSFPVFNNEAMTTPINLVDVTGSFPVTGNYSSGGYSRTDGGENNAESFFYYDANTSVWTALGWGRAATSTIPIYPTVGYSGWAYGTTNQNITLASKYIAKGNQSIQLYAGYNLIPNPYPSPISFDNFYNRSTLGSTISLQINNNGASSFATYLSDGAGGNSCVNCSGGSLANSSWKGEIAVGQSFWVSASGTGTLTLTESDKITTNPTFAGRTNTPQNYIRVALVSGSMSDETIITFKDNGSLTYNASVDALKRLNGYPTSNFKQSYINLSTYKGDSNTPLVFNFVPFLSCQSGNSTAVNLNVADLSEGNHSLKFSDLETFEVGYKITLIDNFLSTNIPITNGYEYKFSTTSDALSFGAQRFALKFESVGFTIPTITSSGSTLKSSYQFNNQWYKNGKVITGATSQTYTVTESGSYTVKSTVSSCSGESQPVVLTITGFESVNSGVSVYPNPTDDLLTITIPENLKSNSYKVSLYDPKGSNESNLGYTLSSNETEIVVSMKNHSSGIYILKLYSNDSVNTFKIIKK